MPNTKLWDIFCTQCSETISHNDIAYNNVNKQLSYRGNDSVHLVKGLDSYRNAPMSNNYLISLWVIEKPCTLHYVIQWIFNVYLEQAGMTLFLLQLFTQTIKLLPFQIWCTDLNLIRESMWLPGQTHACWFHVNEKSPSGWVAGKVAVFFTLDQISKGVFDGHFSFPTEILTGCCRWSCLTFSGCSDGFSICHGQGHRSHCTGMGRGCQDRSEMARHFPYYLTTAVRLQNKNRMPVKQSKRQSSCPTTPLSILGRVGPTRCVVATHALSSLGPRGPSVVSNNMKQQHLKESFHLQSTWYRLTVFTTPTRAM